ncbi:Na+/H+ antiporter NhaC family protein [Oceanobacillus sp. J11TS1]|uniref:Na+/H+ antiporter NhaC family protein n=1 Tax=Oceanobacillus sp. J11TS1 TaxID=2807191 RepID=UPI001B072D8B|nr:Na+/H+ antiporter NhaC family protein [Oceanobacillus sp. J11TS1]GIO25137.1 tetracycline efflux Na+/H+ antiporter family transporter Tet(35) [Oceanobacillus sp. J11TS1]
MEGTIYSLIPAVIMLILVLLTRRVLISIGTGIVVGALLLNDFHLMGTLNEIWAVFYTIFYADGALEIGNILLISFLLFLGVLTAFLQASGGAKAFGDWMLRRVKTRVGAEVMTVIIGLIIFIDDYFNSLAVGQIARPVTDRQRISRAKLAYYIDSSSAPVTVIAPISSWGAYIIGILGGLFVANDITTLQPIAAFIQMIPLNFYAIASIILVFIVAYFHFDIGPMYTHEKRAKEEGELLDPKRNQVSGDLSDVFDPHQDGKVFHLITPIVVLFIATVIAMIGTGIMETQGSASIIEAFANTNVNLSLIIGGVAAVLTSVIFHMRQRKPRSDMKRIFIEGFKTMIPAINILLLAWMIGSIIGALETGSYLAGLVNNSSISVSLLPAILFIIAGLMALATGSSWGTFGIMLPIAAEVMVNTDMELFLPALAAVLAGAVFGDHCTPISDTTILSATGAGAHHIDHVITQLPYAILAAFVALIGFLVVGITHSTWIALPTTVILLAGIVWIAQTLMVRRKKKAS